MSRTTRKPYTGAKMYSRGCRNHGSCKYCENNRTIRTRRAEERAREEMGVYASGEAVRLSTA